ncbi:sensor histidine kinase [Streptosporangium amethystogenes subsp. fukuiense]|uniref:histidine kinase n=1 Tax=Streptosporangium amethystogenes subsp. fukuiense TaxID=698418 RepID=A0ABW2TCY6_9ACTN
MGRRADYAVRAVALALGALGLAALAAHLVIELAINPRPPGVGDTARVQALLSTPLGMLIVLRRPGLIVGWLLLLVGAANGWVTLAISLYEVYGQGAVPLPPPLYWLLCFRSAVTTCTALMLPLAHPDAGLLRPRWRWVYLALISWQLLLLVIAIPRLHESAGPLASLYQVSAAICEPLLWVSLLVLLVRFWRAGPDVRRQIAWLAPVVAFDNLAFNEILGWDYLWLDTVGEAAVPIAVAIAVLRYRLYSIDTLASRALVGGALVVFVATAYLAVGALTGLFLADYGELFGVVAAIFAGLSFLPVQRRLQRLLDRLLYGRSGDPQVHAEALRRQIRHAGPAQALEAAVRAVAEGLAVTGAAVETEESHVVGELGDDPRKVPLVWHGEPAGTLLLGPPGARRFPRAYERRMLAVLVPIVADVAHAVQMAHDLRRSWEQAAGAREEERRRLHRDLHDGLGSRLTGIAIGLEAARRSLGKSPELAHRLLSDLRVGMDAVNGEMRELVQGLRPRTLDTVGLEQSIRLLALEVPVTVEGSLEGLPPAVEIAAYRIMQEALTNARRHSGAEVITVALERAGDLRVRVTDDGVGVGEPARGSGSGLSTMRERAVEVGGTCSVRGGEHGGTVVEAVLPVPV